jgi:hypothetical protein
MKITFHDLLNMQNINPKDVKLVRHGNAQIDILESFRSNRKYFEAYQSFQGYNKFGKAKHIASFSPGRSTTAVFLGLYNIKNHLHNDDLTKKHHSIIDKFAFPDEWKWHKVSSWYHLELNQTFEDLSERLIIDWGKSTVSWVQNKDKRILEIKGANSIGEFVSYDEIQINYNQLQNLSKDVITNGTWINALSAVNGIYLIKDTSIGKLYVGSAYGDNGIYGRWMSYAKNGHGGNVELKKLNPNNFEFSILEIATKTASADEVIHRESRWKEKLGTRQFGLNLN